jgi:cyclic pyranopterin phosphate synthase
MTTAPRKRHRAPAPRRLIDGFGRAVTYLRVSVTDRCDLRCLYCMAEHMTFLPKARGADAGGAGPPGLDLRRPGRAQAAADRRRALVRKGFMDLVAGLSRHLRSGALDELTLTTNGTQLAKHAADLARHGVRRINVSLDTLKPDLFRKLTRGGDLSQVIAGIDAALAAGHRRSRSTPWPSSTTTPPSCRPDPVGPRARAAT